MAKFDENYDVLEEIEEIRENFEKNQSNYLDFLNMALYKCGEIFDAIENGDIVLDEEKYEEITNLYENLSQAKESASYYTLSARFDIESDVEEPELIHHAK